MKLSKALSLFWGLILSGTLLAQTAAETHHQILRLVEQRDYAAAAAELNALKNSNAKIFELNNYDYLLARLLEKRGDFAAAMANYQAVVNRNSILKEYALWHLAQIARGSGNLLLERTYLQEIASVAPQSLLTEAVRTRLARSYFESRDFDKTIQLLGSQLAAAGEPRPASPTGEQRPAPTAPLLVAKNRENLVVLGQAYLESGRPEQARETFNKLVNNLANPGQPDDFALAGAKGLDRLEVGAENFGRTAPALSDYEHLRRASIYQFNRDFPDARRHYQAIIERHPQSGLVPDAVYQIGRGFVQEGNFAEAIKWFERVQEQFPEHPVAKDALSQTASAYARVNKPKEALTRYQKFIEKYPDADNLDRAYLNIVDVLRDQGSDSEALKWTARTQERFRGKLPEAIALFAQTRIRLAQSDWSNALADLDKLLTLPDLGGTRVPGGTNKAEVTFLKGLALEQMQRYDEAIGVYNSIPDGRSEYYGWRATERLQALAADEKTRSYVAKAKGNWSHDLLSSVPEAQKNAAQKMLRLIADEESRRKMLEIIRKTYAELPAYQKTPSFQLLKFGRAEIRPENSPSPTSNDHRTLADELLFLGLYDEGTPELELALKAAENRQGGAVPRTETNLQPPVAKPEDLNYTLAVFYRRGDMAYRAVGFTEPLWRQIPADYQIELIPREQIELLYPVPYADALLQSAAERGVDPRFVLAIMRQESRFRADVKSNAAARGLMQFISTTAAQIARELGRGDFRQDELYHPPTAILFGSQYLANLFRQFPSQPMAVAASYNGGETNMARWLARARSRDPDRYVPEIIFSQSKDYVYKVMTAYRIYQVFYERDLRAK